MAGCTTASIRALPQAIALAQSLRKFHADSEFVILVVDQLSQPIVVPHVTVWGLGDLALPPGEEWRLPMLHRGRELTDLLLPPLLLTLLSRNAGTYAWFECSTLLFAPLSAVDLPDADDVVVATEAIRNDFGDGGRSFIAVRSDSEKHLQGWFERGQRASADTEDSFEGVPHRVTTSPTFAAAYWNLDPKSFASSPRGYEVGGQPLRSFDFRGYDPEKPHLLSRYQGFEPRILLSEWPAIAGLCDEYREKMRQHGAGAAANERAFFEFLPSGVRIDERMRRLYSNALEKFRRGETTEPPSPFGREGEEGFLRWLNEPLTKDGPAITRYMVATLDDRPDVRNAYPDPLGADAAGFREWYLRFGRSELDLPDAVIPDVPRITKIRSTITAAPPVNIAGYFRAELGLGVAARAIVSALEAAGIPFNTVSFGATANRQEHPFVDREAVAPEAEINLICVNPDQLPVFAEETGTKFRHGRYTIGIWFWEVEQFPKEFHGAFNYVDEIWVASEFMRDAFLKVSPKPVFKFRLPVLVPEVDPTLSRRDLGLPDTYVFLFSFDMLSVLERKNPLGLIAAFKRAFPSPGEATLVIKMINEDKRCLEMEKLRYAVRGRPDIILKGGYLSSLEHATLTALSDCYVSLHCSEGFGLTIAEAMALGRPTIATGYSGNLDFMTEENSFLCPYRLRPVGPEREPYPAAATWAEPETQAAAELLRSVFSHREVAARKGQRAAADIRAGHNPEVAGDIIRQRLAKIRQRRHDSSPVGSTGFFEDRIEELQAENAKLRSKLEEDAG